MDNTNKLNKFYFLELIRSIAAIYVVLYHIQQMVDFGQIPSFIFSFGQEAVMIFFVLSGFVINFSVENKKSLLIKEYIKARFLRIYPVFILACVLSYTCQSIISGGWLKFDSLSFIENVFMLQDFSTGKPGVWYHTFMGNTPLWSLSYEWWFYMLFIPIHFYIPVKYKNVSVCILSSIAFITYLFIPNQICLWLMYFIIWWLGVEASRKYLVDEFSNKNLIKTLIICSSFVSVLFVYAFYFAKSSTLAFGIFPILFIRHFLMAILFTIFLWKVPIQKISINSKNILVRIAPYTYAMYVFHFPILHFFRHFNWIYTVWGIPFAIALVFILAFVAEEYIHKYIVKWFR